MPCHQAARLAPLGIPPRCVKTQPASASALSAGALTCCVPPSSSRVRWTLWWLPFHKLSHQRSQQGHSGTRGWSCLNLSLLIPVHVLPNSCGLILKLQPALASPGHTQDQTDAWASTCRASQSGGPECAFLASFQGMQIHWVPGPHFESHCTRLRPS